MLQATAFGSTGINLSPLGLGTVKFGRNTDVKYPQSFDLPDDQTILKLLGIAKDHGINFIDTAPAYGQSEQRIGELLTHRTDWVIVSKVGEIYENNQSRYNFSAKFVEQSIKQSLKNLQTDYIDIILLHSDGNDQQIISSEAFETLHLLKKQGLIRAFGMSSKTSEGGIAALQHTDCVMCAYNPVDQSQQAVMDYAAQHQKGILIKKALASGHIDKLGRNPVADSFKFIFKHSSKPRIVMGTINSEHLLSNIQITKQLLPTTEIA